MRLFIVGIRNRKRRAIYAAFAEDQSAACGQVIGKNEGWSVEFAKESDEPSVFKVSDTTED